MKVINHFGYVSASRAQIFGKCMNQFYEVVCNQGSDQYSNGSKDDDEVGVSNDAVYLTFGKIVHKCLEKFYTADGNKRTKKFLLSLFRKYYVKYGLIDKDYYELGYYMLDDFFSYAMNDAPKRKIVATEQFFDYLLLGMDYYKELGVDGLVKLCKKNDLSYLSSVSDDVDKSVDRLIKLLMDNDVLPRAKGTIDAIFYLGDGVYEIVDYKTSNYQPSQDEVDSNVQVALYDLAFHECPSMKKLWVNGKKPKSVILSMHYLRYGSKGVVQTGMSDEDRIMNKRFYIDTYLQMATFKREDFYPNLNTFCSWCDCCDKCKVFQDALSGDEESDIEFINDLSDETFSECVNKSDKLKSRIKILEKELNESNSRMKMCFKRDHKKESVIVNEREYYLTNYTRRQLYTTTTIKVLKKYGLFKINDFIDNMSVGKVEDICSDVPEAWNEIQKKCLKMYVGAPMIKSRKIPKCKS